VLVRAREIADRSTHRRGMNLEILPATVCARAVRVSTFVCSCMRSWMGDCV
jgi:hypothetical protein